MAITYSSLLDRILKKTESRDDVLFLSAVLMSADLPEEEMAEHQQALNKISAAGIDPGLLDTLLLNSADNEITDDSKSINAIRFDMIFLEAKSAAARKNVTEIALPEIVERMLAKPSNRLKRCIEAACGESARLAETKTAEAKTSGAEKASGSAFEKSKARVDSLVANVKDIRKKLLERIFGQDNAVNIFVTGYYNARMQGLTDKNRRQPKATFLFAGPPGVGKTYLAETAAELLKLPYQRFDMSEYSDKEANLEFCGSDKVYKNGKAGNVTSFVAENPRCVLLFDEIEKAHINVIHLFLQLLDAGCLRDNYTDEEVSFRETIIIFTTNAGKQLYGEDDTQDYSLLPRKVILKALRSDANPETGVPYFPAAICSRFASGNVVMFNHITAHNLHNIARREIERQIKSHQDEIGIKISVDDEVYTSLLFAEGGSADARTVKNRAATFFNEEMFELLRLVSSEKTRTGIKDLESIRFTVDLSAAEDKISSLYRGSEPPAVLVFADEETAARCSERLPGMNVMHAATVDCAIELIKQHSFTMTLVDITLGLDKNSALLNIEDQDSEARNFLRFVRRSFSGLPVYILEMPGFRLDEEERLSYTRLGIRGIVSMNAKGANAMAKELSAVSAVLYQQDSMLRLARENKVVSFETAQTVSRTGKNAVVTLFDFRMAVAVESEDAGSILSSLSKPDVRFDHVIGAGDAKEELRYFVEYLKNPKKYIGTGVKAPRGVLLYGPPGTGKTMLAKAMAGESDITFIAAEGNQFLDKYVGEGSRKVHELFRTARKYAPAILFVDEIDAIAKERKGESGGGEDTLTAFLAEMDGFSSDPTRPVFVLAATNFDVEPGGAKSLDSALMRRFDRTVFIDLPNRDDRELFLRRKMESNDAISLSEDKVVNIAMRSTGMSLAQMDLVVELALRSAIRKDSTAVTDEIFEDAFETFNSGSEKKWSDQLLERVARHEAGHAFLCWHAGSTPSYLTIVARGDHGGYMQHAEEEGKALYTRSELMDRIRISLGGRAAEVVYYGPEEGLSTGAGGDLAAATATARRIICTYGMDEDFGLAALDPNAPMGSEDAARLRSAVNAILSRRMEEAVSTITENRAAIDALVSELMSRNHMSGKEIERVITEALGK